MFVPPDLRSKIFKLCHDSPMAGHFGFVKMLHLLERLFSWTSFHKDVSQYDSTCPVCLMAKIRGGGKSSGLLKPLPTPTQPWSVVSMDFITDKSSSKGKTVIWVVVDSFSKQAHFIPCTGLPTIKGWPDFSCSTWLDSMASWIRQSLLGVPICCQLLVGIPGAYGHWTTSVLQVPPAN